MGRKPSPPGEKRDTFLKLSFTETESVSIRDAAERDRLERGIWARQRLLQLAHYGQAGISLEVAFNAALEALSKNNQPEYKRVLKRLGMPTD